MHTTIRTALCAGAAILALVGGAAAAAPAKTPAPVAAEGYTLRLAEFAFDPLDGLPELPQGWDRVASDGPDLNLVQLPDPPRTRTASRTAVTTTPTSEGSDRCDDTLSMTGSGACLWS